MLTLASAASRVVQLEALREAQREREREQQLAVALRGLDDRQVMAVLVWAFLGRDCCDADPEGPDVNIDVEKPAMGWDEFLAWARAGLPAYLLPPEWRSGWERAQQFARRALAGEYVPELGDMYDWLTKEDVNAGALGAGAWGPGRRTTNG
jgi:hypothetical protein